MHAIHDQQMSNFEDYWNGGVGTTISPDSDSYVLHTCSCTFMWCHYAQEYYYILALMHTFIMEE